MSQVVLLFRSPLQDVATLGFEIDTVNIFTSCSRWQHQCDDCHRGHSCARSERKGLQMVWIPAKSPKYSSAKSSSKRMTNGNVMDAGAVVRNSSVDDHNRHTHRQVLLWWCAPGKTMRTLWLGHSRVNCCSGHGATGVVEMRRGCCRCCPFERCESTPPHFFLHIQSVSIV